MTTPNLSLPPTENTKNTHPKTALITGAGSGIGQATALTFLKAGYRVALLGRTREKLERAAGDWLDTPQVMILHADVSKPEQVAQAFQQLAAQWGRLDVLFNNAGIRAFSMPIEDLLVAQWQEVVDVNLTGMFLCLQQAYRLMKNQSPQGGRIINNGSIAAYTPRPGSIPYTATKHAVTGLTKATALDGRPYQIACGQIDIGNAATDLTAGMRSQGAVQPNGSRIIEPSIDVQIAADAVLHMASLPLSANILFQTVMATNMPYVGRG